MTTPVPPISTPFRADATAAEVVEGIDLTGERVVVTGGSAGIGVATARALAATGAEVTLAVRDPEVGARVAADITATTGNSAVRVERIDLGDLESVADFAARWEGPLHVLVNNAGVLLPDRRLSASGWEMTLATNYLGHFALSVWLHRALAAAHGARIVALTSVAHMRSPVLFEDMQFTERPYDPNLAYGQSKTAIMLFAVEATRRWAADAITANAVNPGWIETGLIHEMDPSIVARIKAAATITWKSPEQGAATTVLVAASPRLDGVGGRYFEDCNEAPVVDSSTFALVTAGTALPARGVAAYAVDLRNAERLWDLALEQIA